MLKKSDLYLVFLVILFSGCSKPSQNGLNQKIWFLYPARYWNSQALHLGNGMLGVSFYGGLQQEQLDFTEKTFWTGRPGKDPEMPPGINPDARRSLTLIRQKIVSGDIAAADSLVQHHFLGEYYRDFGSFSSIGSIYLDFNNRTEKYTSYLRELDLQNALGRVQYQVGDTTWKREYFCSYPDKVFVMKISANRPGCVSFGLSVRPVHPSSSINAKDDMLCLSGRVPGDYMNYQVLIRIIPEGGRVTAIDDSLVVDSSSAVIILMTAATEYMPHYPYYLGARPDTITMERIMNASSYSYEQLLTRHREDYSQLYGRVRLFLNGNQRLERLPTNERVEALKKGASDPGLKVLAFNLGRYLIISSSRPGTLPANLQGVWNVFSTAPWNGNYQSNINLQEIYWPCGPTYLPECQEAYIDWITGLVEPGRKVARLVYGTDGWVSHTTGNIWGHVAPVGDIMWGTYPMASAWHCQHLWDQYAFTMDTAYLRTVAWPVMKEASVFWLRNLFPYKEYLIAGPSVSAEHGALLVGGKLDPAYHDLTSNDYRYNIPGPAQDAEMIWDLFTNTIEAARILDLDKSFSDSLASFRSRLIPPHIGKYGQLQEWYEDIDNPDCHHRHISHLYAVCPGHQIDPFRTPELADAARKALDMRGEGRFPLQEQASGGNWSRCHRIWCWTRLLDGDRANKIFTGMMSEQGFENLLTYQHAGYSWQKEDLYREDSLFCHFQIDASASVPGFMSEMLLQSHLGEIHILPALPSEWTDGEVTGLKARGGYTVDICWRKGKLKKAVIHKYNFPEPVVRVDGELTDPAEDKRIIIL